MRIAVIVLGAALGLVALGVAAFAYVIHIAVEGTGELRRGGLRYALLISSAAKEAPIVEPCTEPIYEEFGRDGTRAPYVTVRYASRASPAVHQAAFDAFLRRYSCVISETSSRSDEYHYACDNDELTRVDWSLGAASPDACASVVVDIELNY